MAASRVDSEVGEYQLTSATAAASSSEARVVKSLTDYNHRAKYIEEPFSRSKFHDHSSKHSNNSNGVTGNHYVQDEEWSGQEEESISENEINIVNKLEDTNCDKMDISNIINDCKLITCKGNNERFSDLKDKLEVTNSINNEIEETQQIFDKCNQMSETIFNNECDEKQTCAVHEIKIATALINNCVNNPSESAYRSQSVDKTIGSSKCDRAKNIESRKNDCNEDEMEISSRSRVYPHGDNVIVSVATSSTGAFREALRDEAFRKVVHSSAKDSRALGKTRRSASAPRNAIRDREKSRDRETDISIPRAENKKSSSARKCENCGESHFPYSRYSRSWKYSDYLNHETANRDTAKSVTVNREIDSTRLTAPIATVALRRSQSLPRLSIHDSGVACSDHAPAAQEQTHTAPRQLVTDLRQLLTLRQHYYPEGGWGWVILLVGLLVQILSHGAHGAVGVFLQQVKVKFGGHVHLQAG